MLANSNVVSCDFTSLALRSPGRPRFLQTQSSDTKFLPSVPKTAFPSPSSLKVGSFGRFLFPKKGNLQVLCPSVSNDSEKAAASYLEGEANGKAGRDWTTSILLCVFWGFVVYYVFFLTSNQTPVLYIHSLHVLYG